MQLAGVDYDDLDRAAADDVLRNTEAPGVESAKVQINEDGSLAWPVLFVYPEYKETDFIQAFHEDST